MKKALVILFVFILFFCVMAGAASNDEKVVYITFDDGPTHNTPLILDTLKKYNAKATFFVLENRISEYPDFIKRLHSEGHAIGLHGQCHDVNVIYSSPSEPLYEMNSTNDSLYNVLGFRTQLARTPYGSYPYMTYDQYKVLCSANYKIWDWTVDPRDGVGTPDISTIFSNIKKDLKGNNNPIVLLHDRKSTAKNLDSILNFFASQGYRFETIDENMDPVNFMELYGPAKNKSS